MSALDAKDLVTDKIEVLHMSTFVDSTVRYVLSY